MANQLNIGSITSGYRPIRDGRPFNKYFALPEERDRIIIENGEVEETVDLMKRVVWKYIGDTKRIAPLLKAPSIFDTCRNIWNFLYHHVQYRLDKKGLEQLRRPNRSWAERKQGIDCDCFSIFVSSILTNLKIPHSFRITKYDKDVFQHVYVIVPQSGRSPQYIIIDCVLNRFNYEKPFTEKKDFAMSLNGINVAVLSGTTPNDVMELVSGLDDNDLLLGADNEAKRLQTIYEHLIKTRNLIASKPELINSVEYPPAFLKMLDYAIDNWNTPNRDKALEILSKNEDAMNRLSGFDGQDDPDFEGVDDKFIELEGDEDYVQGLGSIKSFFKKVGQAVKKGGKFFLRFNPLTMAARGGFLVAMKLNLKKMASKIKWGYATKEQAAAKGISAQDWEKSKKALSKIENLFVDKLQGTRKALKKAVLKGKAGGINGIDEETDISGLGILPAAALAAAVPVITAALKILQETGIMSKQEADNIEAEVNTKTGEANNMTEDPDIKNSAGDSDKTSQDSGSSGGIIGFVKKQPLLVIGGAALGIWGLTRLFSGKKKGEKGLSGISHKKTRKYKTHRGQLVKHHRKRHKKLKSIKLT